MGVAEERRPSSPRSESTILRRQRPSGYAAARRHEN